MTNKELKEEYKNIKFKMGIFQIRNIINGIRKTFYKTLLFIRLYTVL